MADTTTILDGLKIAETLGEAGGLTRSLIAGGVLGIVYMAETAREYLKLTTGEQPSFSAPFKKLIFYWLLLGSYELFAHTIIDTVLSLGTLTEAENEAFLRRAGSFRHHMQMQAEEDAELGELVAGYLLEGLMQTGTWLSYALAGIAITVFKAIQKVGLQVALSIGPMMIAASAIPGPTRGFLGSWVLALIELGLWGFIARVAVGLLDSGTRATFSIGLPNMDTAPNYLQHVIWNGMYVAALFSIPALASLLVRGQSGSGMAQAAATGVMVTAPSAAASGGQTAGGYGMQAAKWAKGKWDSRGGGGGSSGAGLPRPSDAVKPPPPTGR